MTALRSFVALLTTSMLACSSTAAQAPSDAGIDADASGDEGGLVDASGCGFDVTSDPKNCGSCGHDCLGGSCSGGVCQPVAVVGGLNHPRIVRVDDTDAFVLDTDPILFGGRISRVGKSGGPKSTISLPSSLQLDAAPMEIDGNYIYLGYDGLGRVPKSAGGYENLDDGVVRALTIVAGEIIYSKYDAFDRTWILKRSTAPNAAPVPYAQDGGALVLQRFVVNGTNLYFSVHWTSYYDGIFRTSITGISPRTKLLDPGFIGPSGVFLFDSGFLYGASGNTIRRIQESALDGTLPYPTGDAVAIGLKDVADVLITGGRMFIAYSDRIGECPAAGCSGNPPVTRAADQYGPRSLTSDDKAIYWVTYDGGTLMRLAK